LIPPVSLKDKSFFRLSFNTKVADEITQADVEGTLPLSAFFEGHLYRFAPE
jgi:hypothetical protein